jgi:hypothetical protein
VVHDCKHNCKQVGLGGEPHTAKGNPERKFMADKPSSVQQHVIDRIGGESDWVKGTADEGGIE